MTHRELATILAALRMFQEASEDHQQHYPHFEEVRPLTGEQINELCEEMNTTGYAALKRIKLTGIN